MYRNVKIIKTIEPIDSKHRLIGTTQAAEILNVNRRLLVHLMENEPDFPKVYTIGKRRKVKQSELESWIDSRKS